MKFKSLFTLSLLGLSMSAMAQTHVEGAEYFKADQFANAKELLQRNFNNPGTDKAVSNYYLGLIALQDGDKVAAEKYFNQGISENPEYGFNYVGLGELKLAAGDAKEAQRLFKEAEGKTKKSAPLQIAIATAYNDVDPVAYAKEIDKYVEKARKTDMKSSAIYLFEGDVLKDKKDFGGAGAKYEMATSFDPNASEAYVKYANLYTMVNPDYAITKLSELLSINPNSALAQRELANAYYNKKDYTKAAQQYGQYVKNPNHFKQDEDRYAFLLFYGGDYKKGYDYASQLLASNPSNFTAQRYQFMNAAQLQDMKDSLLPMAEALYAAHNANPSANKFAAIDYILIADEYSKAKRNEDAVNVMLEGIKDMPDNANFYKNLASMYVDEGNLAKAADAYQGYLNKNQEPGYNDFVQQALYAYFAGAQNIIDNPEESARYFAMSTDYSNKASEMAPNQYKPVKILGDIAVATAGKEGMASAGQPLYEKAIVLLENSADPSKYKADAKTIYNYLGNYYLDKKDMAKAKSYFNKYLEIDPDNADYRKFVEGLK